MGTDEPRANTLFYEMVRWSIEERVNMAMCLMNSAIVHHGANMMDGAAKEIYLVAGVGVDAELLRMAVASLLRTKRAGACCQTLISNGEPTPLSKPIERRIP